MEVYTQAREIHFKRTKLLLFSSAVLVMSTVSPFISIQVVCYKHVKITLAALVHPLFS